MGKVQLNGYPSLFRFKKKVKGDLILLKVYNNGFSKGRNDSTGKSSFPEQCIGLVDLLQEDVRIAS